METERKHVQPLTEAGYGEVHHSTGVVVLDFWSPRCGPCHVFAPIFEAVTKELGTKAYRVNADGKVNVGLVGGLKIRSLPTVLVMKDGQEVARTTGFMAKDKLKALITKWS